ncbi:MAG: hypothetical protein AAF202_13295, partial [Pseudomonadota bacterium]
MKQNPRTETAPPLLEQSLQSQLGTLNDLLKSRPYLPSVIKGISDHFLVRKTEATPWELDGSFEGYLVYFHTLNTVRMISVLKQLSSRI